MDGRRDRDHAKDERRVLRLEISPRTILLTLLTVLGVWLLAQLWTVAIIVVVALVIVGTLAPVVTGLEKRGVPRGWALFLIFIAMFVVITGLLLLTIPPLVAQVLKILENAPRERAHLVSYLSQFKITAPLAKSIKAVPLDDLFVTAGNTILGYSSQLLSLIGYGITTLFLAYYLLADAKRVNGALYAVIPRAYHLRLTRILLNLETIVGGYIRGQLITSFLITMFTLGLLTIFDVPDALALAIFAGLTDVIPFIGGIIASAPAVLAALSRGTPTALIVLAAMFVYQEFETRILVPRIYGRVLRLSPAVVLLALLIGGTLLGMLGALIALPIAAGLQMMVRELRVELPGDDTDDTKVKARDEKAEAVYERLSAGAGGEEAAVIATELVQRIRQNEAAGVTVTAELPVLPTPSATTDGDSGGGGANG